MEELQTAIEALQRVRETKLAELQAIEQALESLGVSVAGVPVGRSTTQDFEDLGITAATKRYLTEMGEPRSTREIADALLARGVKTKSRKYIATVYATLNNNKELFHRTKDGRWELRQAIA